MPGIRELEHSSFLGIRKIFKPLRLDLSSLPVRLSFQDMWEIL